MKARVIFENGKIFKGYSFGYDNNLKGLVRFGEVVFNTSMSGYQEIITDPSYKSQIINMTFPMIGNYGINDKDFESSNVNILALIVREYQLYYSNYRSNFLLGDYLKLHKIPAIDGVDTRAITNLIRSNGFLRALVVIGDIDLSFFDLGFLNNFSRQLVIDKFLSRGIDFDCGNFSSLVSDVSCDKYYQYCDGNSHVVVVDFGVKFNALRVFQSKGCRVTVVPFNSSFEEILSFKPSGIFLSNGPGDPRDLYFVVDQVRNLIGKIPIFGVCLGHQILSLALGAKVFKLKFGHRGANYPVGSSDNSNVVITSQNHGYSVVPGSLPDDIDRFYFNLDDNSLEGFFYKKFSLISLQYHPESSPGPNDSLGVFDEFIDLMIS